MGQIKPGRCDQILRSEASGEEGSEHDFSLRLVNTTLEEMARELTQRLMTGGRKHLMFLPKN